MQKALEFVTYVVQSIVNRPDLVKVEARTDELGVLITVEVNKEDMGLLIGREGSTAKSLRTLSRAVGMKEHARINIKIAEPTQ